MAQSLLTMPALWQPKPRSQISPPVEVLYHYVRMFSAQGKLVQAWHILRWLHAAYTIASAKVTKKRISSNHITKLYRERMAFCYERRMSRG